MNDLVFHWVGAICLCDLAARTRQQFSSRSHFRRQSLRRCTKPRPLRRRRVHIRIDNFGPINPTYYSGANDDDQYARLATLGIDVVDSGATMSMR